MPSRSVCNCPNLNQVQSNVVGTNDVPTGKRSQYYADQSHEYLQVVSNNRTPNRSTTSFTHQVISELNRSRVDGNTGVTSLRDRKRDRPGAHLVASTSKSVVPFAIWLLETRTGVILSVATPKSSLTHFEPTRIIRIKTNLVHRCINVVVVSTNRTLESFGQTFFYRFGRVRLLWTVSSVYE